MHLRKRKLGRRGAFALTVSLLLCGTVIVCARALREPDIVVYAAGNLRGTIERCGCYDGEPGGLDRLAAFLSKRLREAKRPTLYVHGGPTVEVNNRQSELKFSLTMNTLAHVGCRAYGLAASDLLLGAGFLRETGGRSKVPLIASNLVSTDGKLFFEPFVVTSVGRPGGKELKVGIFSFISPIFVDYADSFGGGGSRLLPVEEQLGKLLERPESRADCYLIFLQGAPHEPNELRRFLSKNNRRVIAIIRMGGDQESGLRARRLFASVFDLGAYDEDLIEVQATLDAEADVYEVTGSTVHALDHRVPSDQTVLGWLRDYVEAMERMRLVQTLPRWPFMRTRTTTATYAGSKSCGDCHPRQYAIWRKKPHARAWQSLKKTRTTANPECVECHVVGLRIKSGFVSEEKTPHLTDVGCESCHGPMAEHVKDNDLAETVRARNVCSRCHTRQHSPAFDKQRYLQKIRHWDLEEKAGPEEE